MKKITLTVLAIAMVFAITAVRTGQAFATTEGSTTVTPITENTDALCHDTLDNDDNGLTDQGELSCAPFYASVSLAEDTDGLCHDGIDNDDDGLKDQGEASCSSFFLPAVIAEDTDALCHDTVDNDDDGLTDQGEASCSPFFPTVLVENTDALCHDTIDNDDDGLTDQGEASCSPFFLTTIPEVIAEDTDALCHDSIDNDDDGLTDQGELSCAPFFPVTPPVTTTPPTTTTDNGGGRTGASGGSGGGGFSSGGNVTVIFPGATPAGTVLGASTDDAAANCSISFKKYMKKGQSGIDVKGLQAFLNSEVGSKLPITGHFGNQTFAAVKAFQLKYAAEILGPWVSVGKLKNNSAATGYVYKTTLRKMNLIRCATLNTPPIPASELN